MKQSVLVGVGGFLLGSLLTILIVKNAVNSNNAGMMKMMGIKTGVEEKVINDEGSTMYGNEIGMESNMSDLVDSLKNKTGDSFDMAFVDSMIVHHLGAIDMAKLAQQNAKHQEIKNLSNQIISSQTGEIDLMKQWRTDWDY